MGVLRDSTTEQFLQTTYPDANIVRFSEPDDRNSAIQGVIDEDIDAFVGDGILTYATVLLKRESFDGLALIPELPLSCEFYGLALPNNDPEWQTVINQYLESDGENEIFTEWFAGLLPGNLNQIDYCLNQ